MAQLKDFIDTYDFDSEFLVKLIDKNDALICICNDESERIFKLYRECEVLKWKVSSSLNNIDFEITLDL